MSPMQYRRKCESDRKGSCMKLKNKVSLVTGAASGNGKAIASLFVKEGAKIVIADINADGAWTCY